MLSDDALQAWLESQTLSVVSEVPLSGGCIAQGFCITLSDGQQYFLKQQKDAEPPQFAAEADGLEALGRAGGLTVPHVYWYSEHSLLMEYLPAGHRQPEFMSRLGEGLAYQHRQPMTQFGYTHDTWCGATRQPNTPCADGYRFFAEHRLRYLGEICVDKALLSLGDLNRIDRISECLPDLIPEQAPALLHGDLWSGNVLTGPDGWPVLIDPAVYQGWPEAELAMTCLFGGFEPDFYDAYEANSSVLPDWRDRIELYNLWHLLNHLSLFGRSYQYEVETILRRYT